MSEAVCCSAISPCKFQRENPDGVCEICERAHRSYSERYQREAVAAAVRLLQQHGYAVTPPQLTGD